MTKARGFYWLVLVAAQPLGYGIGRAMWMRIGQSPEALLRFWLINTALVTAAFLIYGLFSPPCCRHCRRQGDE